MPSDLAPVRRELSDTLRLAGPVVAALLAQNSMSFVDTIMVGRLGSGALAGVALGNTVYFTLMVMCTGAVVAVGPMVAQAFGRGDDAAVGASVRHGLYLALALAAPAFLALWNVAPVLRLLRQQPETIAAAQLFLRAEAFGFLPALWFIALRNFIEGVTRPWPVTVITLMGVLFNVTGNYLLIYGNLGFPRLGIVGSGLTTSFVYWAMFAVLAVYVGRRRSFGRFGVFRGLSRFQPPVFAEVFRIGWPIAIAHAVESGLFMVTALLAGVLGTQALAAHQIAIQCAAFSFMVPLGVGIATSVRVGHAVGRADRPGVRRAGYAGIALGAAFMLLAALVFWLAPRAVISLFLDLGDPANAPVIALATSLLGVAALFQLFDGVQVSASGALRGMKDTRAPMVICLVSYWVVGMAVSVGLCFWRGWGAVGLWWGLVLGLATASVLLGARFVRRSQGLLRELDPPDADPYPPAPIPLS